MKPSNQPTLILTVLFCLFVVAGGILFIISDLETHPFLLLIAILLLIGAASIIARPVAYIMTRKTGSLIFPDEKNHRMPPAYSVAQAKRIQGAFDEGMRLFDAIVKEHPQELPAWRAMVEITMENLKDRERAHRILERGLAALTKESSRRVLQQTFDEGAGG